MTPFKQFESLKEYKAMAFPHHPAADWVIVSAATDWDFHDEQIQRLAEIFSRHANFEDFESQSTQQGYCCLQTELEKLVLTSPGCYLSSGLTTLL